MSATTSIEWTDRSWNPVRGCSRVSEGCRNCYAERVAARFSRQGLPYAGLVKHTSAGPRWTGDIALVEKDVDAPLRWRQPARIFVNSMSDLFHDGIEDDFIARLFAVMVWARWHTFQVLTKRPERMRALLTSETFRDQIAEWVDLFVLEDPAPPAVLRFDALARRTDDARARVPDVLDEDWPIPNVWLGVSVEDQATADERIPLLLQTPAAIRFVSYEPALGRIDLSVWMPCHRGGPHSCFTNPADQAGCCECSLGGNGLDWVIAGGESGPHARPAHPDWFRSVRDQCQAAGVPFFFKQWGEWAPFYDRDRDDPDWQRVPKETPGKVRRLNLAGGCGFHGDRVVYLRRVGKKAAGRELDGRTWDEFPAVEARV